MLKINLRKAKNTDVGKIILKTGSFESEIIEAIAYFFFNAKRGIFINVGSNIGIFPLVISRWADLEKKDISTFAHEPLPQLQEISNDLQRDNNSFFNLSGIALSDFIGIADFFVSKRSDSSNSLVRGFRESKDIIQVPVSTLDEIYFQKLTLDCYDVFVLVIDVETAEPSVLRGGYEIIKRFRPIIICEVLAGRTEQELQSIIHDLDYVSYRYNGESWILDKALVGDPTYKFRDWLFIHADFLGEIEITSAVSLSFFF